ncbi:MAG: hypothetical protein WKF92_09595 [Pyrinomonadaceae bacterium]
MKTIRFLTILLLAFGFFFATAEAQRKRPIKRPVPKPVVTGITNADVIKAKDTVAKQITYITNFTDKLPPYVQAIEDVDRESKTKKLRQTSLDLNGKMKRDLIQTLRNFRAGLSALETDFRTKPALRKYLLKIEGIAALSLQSEDLAAVGRYSEISGPLTSAAGKLRDTLATMR